MDHAGTSQSPVRSAAYAAVAGKSGNDLAEMRTVMAARRTLMAADRTLMAWVRTGLSMISFGFTIYKILDGLQQSAPAAMAGHSPRTIGLFLTGLGTASIVMGSVEYITRYLEARSVAPLALWRPSLIIAVVMSAAGLFLFFGIIFEAI